MKFHHPPSNIQKIANLQAPRGSARKKRPALKASIPHYVKNGAARAQTDREQVWYPQSSADTWTLNETPNGEKAAPHAFDLEERTAKFGEAIVRFSRRIPRDPSNNRLIDQLVGCGTSVGANYREGNESVSQKDFRLCISRCVKEAKETKFFLRMIAASEPKLIAETRQLYKECHELHMIFATIFRKL